MKIALFLNNDIHSAMALRCLSSFLLQHEVKIFLSQKIGGEASLPKEIIEMKKYEEYSIQDHFNYDTTCCLNVNSADFVKTITDFAPDLIISIRFGQIFKSAIIKIPKYGILNLHSGILPNYRGVLASFWAILNGEKKIGTTLHYVTDSTIDTGKIIGFSKCNVDPKLSLSANISNLYNGGYALLVSTIDKICDGQTIDTIEQKNLGEGAYFSYPDEDDVKKFLEIMPLF